MARPNPNSRSRDMLISLSVLLVPLVLLIWFFTDNPEAKPQAIDIKPALVRAEAESPYPVLRATALPEGWLSVRAAWAKSGSPWIDNKPADANIWQVGYFGPDGIYYAVEQRDSGAGSMILRTTRQGHATGQEITAAGLSWQVYQSEDGRTTSLVAQTDAQIAVVSADTTEEAVIAFTQTLSVD